MLLLPDGFTPGFAGPEYLTEPAWWFIYAGDRLLTHLDEQHARIPFGLEPPPLSGDPLRRLYMGCYAGNHCYALEVPADTLPPPGLGFKGLRSLWGTLAEDAIGLAGQALQLVDWDRCHQFCGRCGQTTVLRDNERSKHCPACGLNHYPRHAPAVMVRITRGDEILLARSPRFAPGMYSVLAGFVDPGETIEQAAHREVMEEVGLQIKNLRYFTSQSWPFPHSLMIGFSADYAGGDIVLEDPEIEDAGWYKRDNLPISPITMSIARALIDDWLRQ
ncbi:MAG: NAD(+) diphosphatase [Candidatus Competibacteraceae bacterium]|nr:NAD(+) diphosphatase [Candidatus Competibacteraceae bacterium]MCB1815536.1 NAD(+) diphosphatase [Candidatus Competibacteraceae bacterium]